MTVPQRRTQRERREGTIRKLLDAATETLIEHGYADASVQRICDAAGVSQGALFRHFATREELMVAVGEDVGARILERYRRRFTSLGKQDKTDVTGALELVRDACRSRINQAWYELEVAARTNDTLRKALEPASRRYFASITELARELLPELAERVGPSFELLVTSVIALFDGETMHRFVDRNPELEEARLALLARGVQLFSRA